KTSEELRQEFIGIYMPRIRELGLTIPDTDLALDPATGVWAYDEPDWNELRTVVTNHGPRSQERLQFRRDNWAATQWVRDAILGGPPADGVVAELRPRPRRASGTSPAGVAG
ncbi:MAG: ring,2-phenylacetyl-CoA epoxidase subunit PaaA, partial [Chloroflexota bacterium]|nr:ring,2-phenylacetyl-CoA epoxidase subunit PaaA [Chloroflexota bacterium]